MDDNPYRAPLFNEGCLTDFIGKRSACYRSTPEHIQSFVGRFLYIYTEKGELELTADALTFSGKRGSLLAIPLAAITQVSLGRYSRWAKPIRLNYIEIRYRDRGVEHTTLLTPTRSWVTSVWETNNIVADWMQSLEAAWRS